MLPMRWPQAKSTGMSTIFPVSGCVHCYYILIALTAKGIYNQEHIKVSWATESGGLYKDFGFYN